MRLRSEVAHDPERPCREAEAPVQGRFQGPALQATLILQAVSWYLRYPLSYRDIEELFLERGLEVDHSTLNRWVLAYAPLIERRLRTFRKPHCGSIRVDETYIKIRGQWRYLYRAIDKHGNPVDFLLTAKRDLEAAKRFFRKALQDRPLLSPDRIGTDGAGSYPAAIAAARKDGLLARTPVHYVTKHLQQGIESDHFQVKRPMPRVGCFQAFHTARRTIQGFEAMLWLRKGFGFAGALDGVTSAGRFCPPHGRPPGFHPRAPSEALLFRSGDRGRARTCTLRVWSSPSILLCDAARMGVQSSAQVKQPTSIF